MYKNFIETSFGTIPYCFRHILLKMKLTALLVVLAMLQVHASSFAQKITLKAKNATLKEIVAKIRQQADYDFLYNNRVAQELQPITVDMRNKDIREVLDACFANQSLDYNIRGKTILLQRKVSVISQQEELLTGIVVDERDKPLAGVTIKNKSSDETITADDEGHFQCKINLHTGVILIQFLGYESQEINLNGKHTLQVSMKPLINDLNEVVVVGYGTQKKENVIGSVATINASSIENRSTSTLSSSLAGLAAGVNVQASTGKP